MNDTDALLLLCHGARDPAWARPFEAILSRMQTDGRWRPQAVRLSFLEFMTPSLVQAGHELAALRPQVVHVVPLFLGTGGHVRKDVPALMAQLQSAHPDIAWRLHPSLGESDTVVAAIADWACSLGAGPAA